MTHNLTLTNATTTLICSCGDQVNIVYSSSSYILHSVVLEYNGITTIPKFTNNTITFNIPSVSNIGISTKHTFKLYTKIYNIDTSNYIKGPTLTVEARIIPQYIINSPGTFHIIDTQIIDNNKLFCVFETDNQHTLITHIQQSANRLEAYYKKIESQTVPVFTSTIAGNLLSAISSSNYDVMYPDITVVLMVPVSAKNVDIVPQKTF